MCLLAWAGQYRERAGGGTRMSSCVLCGGQQASNQSGGTSQWGSVRYVHVAWDAVGLLLFEEGQEAEAVKVLEIAHRDCVSWKVKEAKEGMKPGKQI